MRGEAHERGEEAVERKTDGDVLDKVLAEAILEDRDSVVTGKSPSLLRINTF